MLPLAAPLLQTSLRARPPHRQGKVQDLYDFSADVLIVATDRPRSIVPNHLVSTDPAAFPAPAPAAADWRRGRSVPDAASRGVIKQPPVPSLPDDVVAKARETYVEAFLRLTGRELQ